MISLVGDSFAQQPAVDAQLPGAFKLSTVGAVKSYVVEGSKRFPASLV